MGKPRTAMPGLLFLIEKQAAPVSISTLKEIKAFSDNKQYKAKHARILALLRESPGDWNVDNDNGRELGVTHTPTGFRYHIPKRVAQSIVNGVK